MTSKFDNQSEAVQNYLSEQSDEWLQKLLRFAQDKEAQDWFANQIILQIEKRKC